MSKVFSFLLLGIFLLTGLYGQTNIVPVRTSLEQASYSGAAFSNATDQLRFSTFYDKPRQSIDFYSAYLSSTDLYVANDSNTPDRFEVTLSKLVNLQHYLPSNSTIRDYCYFISNREEFLALSYTYNNIAFLKVLDLTNQRSFTLLGNTIFTISLVTRFSNSPDVYFVVYNSFVFDVIKYTFATTYFTEVVKSNSNTLGGYPINTVSTFELDNKIYTDIIAKNATNTHLMISNILIIDSANTLYNLTLHNKEISTFTTYGAGLLFYETNTNTFYTFTFENGTINTFNSISSIDFASAAFKPFDNQSFLFLNSNTLAEIDFLYKGDSLVMQENTSYVIRNSNHPDNQEAIQAFELHNEKFYAFCGINTNNTWEIAVGNINYGPAEFTINQSNIVDNSNINGLIIVLLGVIIIVLILAVVFLGLSLQNTRLRRNTQRKYLEESDTGFKSKEGQISTKDLAGNKITCQECGQKISPQDNFCQNCGTIINHF